jgi:predicted transposase YdaD
MEKGMFEAASQIARRLLLQQFPVSSVAQLTGLSEKQVEAIRVQLKG